MIFITEFVVFSRFINLIFFKQMQYLLKMYDNMVSKKKNYFSHFPDCNYFTLKKIILM